MVGVFGAACRMATVFGVLVLAGCSSGSPGTSQAASSSPDSTPADAVNRYVDAADHGDLPGVVATICQAHRAETASADVGGIILGNSTGTPHRDHGYTLTIGPTTLAGDSADVSVSIAEEKDGRIQTATAIFHVVREGGVWLICEIHGFGRT